MTPDDYAKTLLAVVIWREARGDGPDAMRAVANVIRNRAAKLQLGSDAEKLINVITSRNQFSSMTIIGDSQTVLWPRASDVEWIQAIIDNPAADNTSGALFYANENLDIEKTSPWYFKNIIQSPDHPVLAVVGKQTFRK